MKFIDRYLTVRRAILIALNPKAQTVMISYKDKNGELKTHNIFSDKEKAKAMYLEHWENLFLENSKDAESLKTKLINFTKGIQDRWNESNRTDPLRVIKTQVNEFKSSKEDREIVEKILGGNMLTVKGMIKILLLNKYNAFADLHPDDTWYIEQVDNYIEQFYAKLDSVFYTANGLESDRDFAISIGHQPFAYVLFLARKTGNMVDHTFNNMPLYYRIKIISCFINEQLSKVKNVRAA